MGLLMNKLLFLVRWNPLDWGKDAIKTFFLVIDTTLYYLIRVLWDWIFNKVITIEILTTKDIVAFSNRIYAIIGILVLFFVSYKIITYIVNPDGISDKKKGFGKITSRVFIAILLTIAIPLMFQYALKFQKAVLDTGFLSKIVTGKSVPTNETGKAFTVRVWSSFMNYEDFEEKYNDNNIAFNEANFVKVLTAIDWPEIPQVLYDGGDYDIFIGSLVAGVVIYLLLTIIFDLILRAIKLAIIQLTAPIFIALYIIDDSGSKFNNWFKVTMSTFGMLFIKLITIYFVADWIPRILGSSSGKKPAWLDDPILAILVIITLFYFVKLFPKFISSLFHIDESLMTGDGAKLLKSVASTAAGVGMAVATGGAAALGGAAGAFAGAGGGLKGALAGAGKLTTGAFSTAAQGVKGGMEGYKNQGLITPFSAGKKASQDHLAAKYKKQEARSLGKPVEGSMRDTFKKDKEGYETRQFNRANAAGIAMTEAEKKANEARKAANERADANIMSGLRNSAASVASGGAATMIPVTQSKAPEIIENLRKQGLNNDQINDYFNGNKVVIAAGQVDANGKTSNQDRIFDYKADASLAASEKASIDAVKERTEDNISVVTSSLNGVRAQMNVNNSAAFNTFATHHQISAPQVSQLVTEKYTIERMAADGNLSMTTPEFTNLVSAFENSGASSAAEIGEVAAMISSGSVDSSSLSQNMQAAVAAWDSYVSSNSGSSQNLDVVLDLNRSYSNAIGNNTNLDKDIQILLSGNNSIEADLADAYYLEQQLGTLKKEQKALNKREKANQSRIDRTGI